MADTSAIARNGDWPDLPIDAWQDTCATLHRWTQVIGKIRLAQLPLINHWWQVPLYVSTRGLTTGAMPIAGRAFHVDFDFIDHQLVIGVSDGRRQVVALAPKSVATFYTEVMAALHALDIDVRIWPMPVEIAAPVRFDADEEHASYDAAQVERFWRILLSTDRVFTQFRAPFMGKVSPVHFFWGSFDLAVTRFSGRPAPPHPGTPGVPDRITREAYSHEVSSCGFWPGAVGVSGPVFYAYAYPTPPGFAQAPVGPAEAFYSEAMGEFLLPYEAVAHADRPADLLLEFLQTTYAAAADLGRWDRAALERAGSESWSTIGGSK
jgi:hypothetical protein